MENQGQLITALLTMARAWYVAGCPKPNTPKLGSFESWCDTIGGILQFAGITDFLGNQEKMYELSDVEGQEWEMFLLAWQERYGDAVVLLRNWWKKSISKAVACPADRTGECPDKERRKSRSDLGLGTPQKGGYTIRG
jgi:hypothetical protein